MINISHINISKKKDILKDASIVIHNQGINVVTGPSGSGKTLLLYIVGLLQTKQQYQYMFNGENLNDLSSSQKAKFIHENISFVFQENTLIEYATVYENLKMAFIMHNQSYTKEKFLNILNSVNLKTDLNQTIRSLSRGQRQRLSIAIALVKEPKLLILDEPTSFLDKDNEIAIIKIIKELNVDRNMMILIASHSNEVIKVADYVYKIQDCKILPVETVIEDKLVENKVTSPSLIRYILHYINIYLYRHLKSFIKLFVLIVLLCGTVLFNQKFSQIYISSQIDDFNKQIDNGIVLHNGSGINEDVFNQVKSIHHVTSGYYYQGIPIVCEIDGKTEVKLAGIGYPEQALFNDQTGLYIKESQGTNDYYLENASEMVALKIVGSIPEEYIDPISNQKCDIVIPYDLVKYLIEEKDTVILYLDSIENTFAVQSELLEATSDIFVYPLSNQLNLIKDNLDTLTILSNVFSFIIIAIISIMIIGIYNKMFASRNKELQILKAMGLANRDIIIMILIELSEFLGLCWILFTGINFMLPSLLSGISLLLGMGYISVLMFMVTLFTIKKYLKKEIADVLRS